MAALAEPKGVILAGQDFAETRALREIPVDQCFIDDVYQRPRNEELVASIEADLSFALFGVVTVSARGNGLYAVIDGQNRVEGARRVGLQFVPALVLYNLTREQEAELFADLQRKRKNNGALDHFKAELAAKRHRAVEIAGVLESRGVSVGRARMAGNERVWTVAAISAVQDVWGWNGATLVAQTFDAIMVAWPDAPGRFRADIVRGVGRFILDFEPEQWRLVLALEAINGPDTLMERAGYLRKGRGTGRGTERYPVEVIETAYLGTRKTRPRNRDDMGRKVA